jgi:iron complex outermembrane receptor protein
MRNRMITSRIVAAGFCLVTCCPQSVSAQTTAHQKDITELSLEDLMEVNVTSVSRREESANEVAAALFVLNNEDIRRSGAQSIPEVLRLVPGLHVAQIDTNRWAVTARGSNSLFSNKLLVLIDGRSVYTQLFSGVYWDAQDTRLEDIDQIEVIRGPGASVWGANAVNGVINIITKSAHDTVGGAFSGGVGSEERGFANMRYGEKLSDTSAVRGYAKYFNRDRSASIDGNEAYDGWDAAQGGGRFDYKQGSDSLTIQGDVYRGRDELQALLPATAGFDDAIRRRTTNYDGNNILARWQSGFANGRKFEAQAYYDRTQREDVIHREHYETMNLEAQYSVPLSKKHDLMFGVGYRNTRDFLPAGDVISFDDSSRKTELFSGFVQTESRFFDDAVRLTIGSKFEKNSYTRFEVQPTARVAWLPDQTQTVWASVSRAMRTPSRVEDGARVALSRQRSPEGFPILSTLNGSPDFEAEALNAYELGYRFAPWSNYSFDVSAYYNNYSDLINSRIGNPIPRQQFVEIPAIVDNAREADGYGIEIVNTWRPVKNWTLQSWYTWMSLDVDQAPNSLDSNSSGRTDPHNQAFLRSLLTLPGDIDLDAYLRYVDSVPLYGIDAYVDLTMRVAFRYSKDIEFAVVGANLLDSAKYEYISDSVRVAPAKVQRSVLGTVSFKF